MWDGPNYENEKAHFGGKWIFFTQQYMSRPFYPMPCVLGKEAKYFKGKSHPLNKVEGPAEHLLVNFAIKFYHGKKRLWLKIGSLVTQVSKCKSRDEVSREWFKSLPTFLRREPKEPSYSRRHKFKSWLWPVLQMLRISSWWDNADKVSASSIAVGSFFLQCPEHDSEQKLPQLFVTEIADR